MGSAKDHRAVGDWIPKTLTRILGATSSRRRPQDIAVVKPVGCKGSPRSCRHRSGQCAEGSPRERLKALALLRSIWAFTKRIGAILLWNAAYRQNKNRDQTYFVN